MTMQLRKLARLACVPLAAAVCTVPSRAQMQPAGPSVMESKTLDIGVMYFTQVTNYVYAQKFWMQGGGIDAAYPVYKPFSVAVSFSGLHGGGGQITDVALTTTTFTAGPRYTLPISRRSRVFGQALFGVTHGSDSTFPTSNGSTPSSTAFALQAGAGYDIQWRNRIAFRVPAVDYVRTDLPNGTTNAQNILRISGGIVFTLARK